MEKSDTLILKRIVLLSSVFFGFVFLVSGASNFAYGGNGGTQVIVNQTGNFTIYNFINNATYNSTYDATSQDVTANRSNWFNTFNSTYNNLLGQNCAGGLVVNGTYSNGSLICVSSGSGSVLGNGNAGYLALWNATNSINSSVIFQNGSNIGIGTTTPQSLLQIGGTPGTLATGLTFGDGTDGIYQIGADYITIGINSARKWDFTATTFGGYNGYAPTLKNIDATSTNPGFYFRDDVDTGMGYGGTDTLSFIGGGVNAMNINGSNVGIGTTSPSAVLHVIGTNNPSIATAIFNAPNSGVSPVLELKDASATPNRWQIGSGYTTATDGKFYVYDARQSQGRLVIDTSGNVGIGTTTPQALLSLGNAISAQKFLLYDNNNNYKHGFGIGAAELKMFFPNEADSKLSIGTIDIADGTTFSSKVTVLGTGNVGIGTTTPGAKLEVKAAQDTAVQAIFQNGRTADNGGLGGIQLGSGVASQNAQLLFDNTGDNHLNIVTSYSGGTGNYISFSPGGSEKVRFQQNGNVGIGTTSPGYPLHLKSSAAYDLFVIEQGSNNKKWSLGTPNGETFFGIGEVGVANQLVVAAGGNVGIGTTNPNYLLQVGSGSGTQNSSVSLYVYGNVSSNGYITRTKTYDKTKGTALSYIKDADTYKYPNGTINHDAFNYSEVIYKNKVINGTKTTYTTISNLTGYKNSWKEYQEQVANITGYKNVTSNKTEIISWNKDENGVITPIYNITYFNTTEPIVKYYNITKIKLINEPTYENVTVTNTENTYKDIDEKGVLLDDEIALLKQAIYEMKTEVCLKENKKYSFC